MRYVVAGDGRSLGLHGGPLDLARAAAIVAQVADPPDAGLVRRDVRPANILLDARSFLSELGRSRHIESISSSSGGGHGAARSPIRAPGRR
jgi:hypothetical protein